MRAAAPEAIRAAVVLENNWIGGDVTIRDVTVQLPPEPRDQRWLEELRRYVGREVEEWLEAEVGGEPLLRLNKQELAEAVGRRRPVLVDARAEGFLLDPEEALGDVFVEEAGRSLLVLGEPGSGKSVLLRQLARDLLARAEADAREPVPVLLDLAGWTDDGRPFLDWLASADGLRRSYRGYTDAQLRAWLTERRLTLLLDGLDEVRTDHRAACVGALAAFAAGTDGGAPGGLAVCCRIDEYRELVGLGARLPLGAAVYLQPLTEEQVDGYLDDAGPRLDGLRAAWHADPAVRDLARNPLMLRTMSLAFERLGPAAPGSGEDLRERLLEAYVARVLERAEERFERREEPEGADGLGEGAAPRVFGDGDAAGPPERRRALPYDPAETLRRLGWLARQLLAHGHATFFVEEIQPSWLRDDRSRRAYVAASRCAGGLLLGLTAGGLLLLGLGASGTLYSASEAASTAGIVLALSVGGALAAGVLDARRLVRLPAPDVAESPRARPLQLTALLVGMGLLGGLLFASGGLRGEYGLLFGGLWGAVVAVVFEPGAAWRRPDHDVRLVEPLRWSWSGALRAARRGLGVGALTGAAGGALLAPLLAWEWAGGSWAAWAALAAVAAAGAAAVGAAVGGALGGLKHGNVRADPRPNLGLRLSLRNAAFAGGTTALAAAVVLLGLGLAAGAFDAAATVRWSLGGGAFCGLLAALRYGGLNAAYHFTLRGLLALAGHFPFATAGFLDYAAALSLMRRAGGSYAFAHRSLAEHLAGREARGEPLGEGHGGP